MKTLTVRNRDSFFDYVVEGQTYTFHSVFCYRDIERLASIKGVRTRCYPPDHPKSKLHGVYNFTVLKKEA
ncbi:hypothetical protein IMZ31_22565 (plasmid) [Pontibacillus sp. ALD_SL1]|uniref:hypothetical protein n=1 Tax=Pontibacillus sp. ALD_SL1 TaxID=2777185 RepID=UPI001A95C638|nr:hypothetical protein [Pontibacillus sp. ALD_SL1]QST02240.1 hypothetical protein IMZ31_22565 [Pontibacillus sp. ALD_SL1]